MAPYLEMTAHAMHASPAFVGRHLERRADRPDKTVDVERIDQHRAVDLLGGSGESAQEQHAAFVELAGNVLLGDEVHSVLQG